MGKKIKNEFKHKLTLEFTTPKNKKTFMKATFSDGNKCLDFEGELKMTGKRPQFELPKNYHTDYREDTNKYFWYYLGRKEGKKDFNPKKYFTKHEDAIKDAIKHYSSNKK